MEFLPTINQAKETGIDIASIAGGMVAANIAVKAIKKDNLLVNGTVAVAALAVATKVKSPALKMMLLGASVFGTMRCLTIAVKGVTGNTQGIAGLIPESIKAKIAKFLPQLNGAETLLGEYDDFGDVNLDDVGTVDANYEEVESTTNGFGSSLLL